MCVCVRACAPGPPSEPARALTEDGSEQGLLARDIGGEATHVVGGGEERREVERHDHHHRLESKVLRLRCAAARQRRARRLAGGALH